MYWMKKYLVLLAALCLTMIVHAEHQVFGRSFMFTKPAYYNMFIEQALWHDIEYNKHGKVSGGLQIIPFFQGSSPLSKSARYFLIKGKTQLLISGDANSNELPVRDIRAEWLGLPSDFSGYMSLNPQQKQYGCVLEYNQDLKQWFDVAFLRDMFISLEIPILGVENKLHLEQSQVINEGTNFPQNIIEAFNQPSWLFSKMPAKKKRAGVAEIKAMLGSSYISENYLQLIYYSALVIPTSKAQHAEWMFDAVIGNNKHMGVGAGVNMQVPLNRDMSSHVFSWVLNLESIILIRNKQWRTFDLRDKPYSRFLLMNTLGGPPNTNIPGVNLLTRKATIKPFNMVDFTMGWRVNRNNLEFELGWGIWGHGFERVEYIDDNHEFELLPFGIAGTEPGTTAHRSTISHQAPNDTVNGKPDGAPLFVAIQPSDVDLHSGSNKGALDFRLFMSGGSIQKGTSIDHVIGGGWSVDIPYINSALQVWCLWLKYGVTF